MSSEPHPSRTAENNRFSITAVIAIHHRLEKAVASEGAMTEGDDTVCAGNTEENPYTLGNPVKVPIELGIRYLMVNNK